MVSHSQFIFLGNLNGEKEKLAFIEDFYDSIRNTNFAKHNPFFWEQFASAYIDMKKFDLVKKCIDTALVEAQRIPGFVPFQVKTVQGRYYVEKEYYDLVAGKSNSSEAMDAISNATDAVRLFYNHPENNLYYVFKVVRFFPMIFGQIENMNSREASIYIEKGVLMKKCMEEYLQNCEDTLYCKNIQEWHDDLTNSIEEAKKLQ